MKLRQRVLLLLVLAIGTGIMTSGCAALHPYSQQKETQVETEKKEDTSDNTGSAAASGEADGASSQEDGAAMDQGGAMVIEIGENQTFGTVD